MNFIWKLKIFGLSKIGETSQGLYLYYLVVRSERQVNRNWLARWHYTRFVLLERLYYVCAVSEAERACNFRTRNAIILIDRRPPLAVSRVSWWNWRQWKIGSFIVFLFKNRIIINWSVIVPLTSRCRTNNVTFSTDRSNMYFKTDSIRCIIENV